MPTFGSLFAGIGGIDLGLERAGWECRWQVEWDAYCQRVLAKHWPDVPRYGDITAVDWSGVERVDLLAGGFPCQPVSDAGKKLAQDDERWLWPEFYRAIRALRPDLVLVENVPGLLARGLDDVLGDLATVGYDAEWDCLPAAALGAPHLRDRLWLVAYPNSGRRGQRDAGQRRVPFLDASRDVPDAAEHGWRQRWTGRPNPSGQGQPKLALPALAHAASLGPPGPREHGQPLDQEAGRARQASEPRDGGWWSPEPDVGRVAHGVPARVDRLRALGNAVVPQVVEVIGRQLLEAMKAA